MQQFLAPVFYIYSYISITDQNISIILNVDTVHLRFARDFYWMWSTNCNSFKVLSCWNIILIKSHPTLKYTWSEVVIWPLLTSCSAAPNYERSCSFTLVSRKHTYILTKLKKKSTSWKCPFNLLALFERFPMCDTRGRGNAAGISDTIVQLLSLLKQHPLRFALCRFPSSPIDSLCVMGGGGGVFVLQTRSLSSYTHTHSSQILSPRRPCRREALLRW